MLWNDFSNGKRSEFQLVETSRNTVGTSTFCLLTYSLLHCACYFTRQFFICYLNRVSYTHRFNGYFPGKLRSVGFNKSILTLVQRHQKCIQPAKANVLTLKSSMNQQLIYICLKRVKKLCASSV